MRRLMLGFARRGGGSAYRRILCAAAVVAGATLAVKAIALVKEMVVAARMGTGDALDCFLVAFLVPSFAAVLVGGSLQAAFMPVFVRVRREHGAEAGWRLFAGVSAGALALSALLGAAIVFAAPGLLPLLASGFSPEKLARTEALLPLLCPVVVLRSVGSVWAAALNAMEHFALCALAPAAVPAAVIAALALSGSTRAGEALALGTALGTFAEVAAVGALLRSRGAPLRPRWRGFDADLRVVASQALPMFGGTLLLSSTTVVDQAMAAALGAGSLASLVYGYKLVAFPVGLGATALGTAAGPQFAKLSAARDWEGADRTLRGCLTTVFAAGVPAAVALALASAPLVTFLLQRGSFSAADTPVVAGVLALYALQIPFHLGGIVIVRLLSAVLGGRLLLVGNLLSVALNVALNVLFVRWMGVKGIALSTSAVYLVSFGFLWTAWRRRRMRLA